jgi:type III secretion protein O
LTEYPLAPLFRVRRLREEAAGTEYSAAEAALLEARKKVAEGEKALAEYLRWREEEEERRYQSALFSEMDRKDLEAFRAGLAALRDRENSLREELALKKKAEEEASQARDRAQENLLRARRNTEKIRTHREIWSAVEAREAERREDLEMEEFSGTRNRDDGENEMNEEKNREEGSPWGSAPETHAEDSDE